MRSGSGWMGMVMLVLFAVGCDSSLSGLPEGNADDLRPGYAIIEGDSGVSLRAEGESVAPGGSVTLVLDNQTESKVGYNLCFHGMERRSGNAWVLLENPRVCLMILYLLEPGASATFETVIPAELSPGEYRYRAAVYLLDGNEYRDQVTDPFQVGG